MNGLKTGLYCFTFHTSQWQTQTNTFLLWKTVLSILTVSGIFQYDSRVDQWTELANSCIISAGVCEWKLLVTYWKQQNEMKVSTTTTVSSSAGLQQVFKSEISEYTHWLFLAKVLCVFMKQEICLQASDASTFNEIFISVCSSKYVSHVA